MGDQHEPRPESIEIEELQEVDRICDEFEASWKAGKHPRIEDYLGRVPDNCRGELLRYLVSQEIEYRIEQGETPTLQEYSERFPPEFADNLHQAFSSRRVSTEDQAPDTTHSTGPSCLDETLSAASSTPSQRSPAAQPKKIGRYEIIRILGHGGFGTVYLARDQELERDVAIKVWHAQEEDAEDLLREARTVAGLEEHPNIVSVYDVGRTDDGDCYVVLEYVEGTTLADELKSSGRLPCDRAAEVLLQVTAAIQHAHATGLVHRDLKPANVLLDSDGNAQVADFGLAVDEQTQRDRKYEIAGTPAYMAPEQVRGEAHRMDGRSDIWALGVMLYETLTGSRPFGGEDRNELFDEILHREPKPPRQIHPEIPERLEQICLKCLSKDVTDRYGSASDVARELRDLQLEPEPRKRRPVAVWLSTVAVLIALVSVGVALLFRGNDTQPDPAPLPRISIQPGAGITIRLRSTLRGHTNEVWSVAFSPDDATLASAGVDKVIKIWDVKASREVRQLTDHEAEVRRVVFSPKGDMMASAAGDGTIFFWETGDFQSKHEVPSHEMDVRSVAFTLDGTQLLSGSIDKTIRSWNSESGEAEGILAAAAAGVQCIVLSPDGTTIATGCDDGAIRLYDSDGGEPRRTLTGHTDGVCHIAYSRDGTRLASASWDGTMRLWDTATGQQLTTIEGHEEAVRSVAFSSHGCLASGGDDHTIRLCDAATGEHLATIREHTGPVTSVAFSSDGTVLASASGDKTVKLWEIEAPVVETTDPEPPSPHNPDSNEPQSQRDDPKPAQGAATRGNRASRNPGSVGKFASEPRRGGPSLDFSRRPDRGRRNGCRSCATG